MPGIRGRKIEEALSMMKAQEKHILYLVTEDRYILENVAEDLHSLCYYLPKKNRNYLPRNALRSPFTVESHEILRGGEQAGLVEQFFDSKFYQVPARTQNTGGQTSEQDGSQPRFFLFRDFHQLELTRGRGAPYLLLYQFLQMVRNITQRISDPVFPLLFLISPLLKLPAGMESEVVVVDIPEPDREEISFHLSAWERERHPKAQPDPEGLRLAADDFRAMQISEISAIYTELTESFPDVFDPDLRGPAARLRRRLISEHKEKAARADSTVTVLKTRAATAGMKDLQEYIRRQGPDFLHPEEARLWGVEPPKGILLTGVPGSGKTQAAKSTAYILSGMNEGSNVPLVQFRMDNILGGLVGDSEQNFKRCRKRVEALAPCVVLFDEIEKTFATDGRGGNNDVKMNIFSALLDWMQENDKQIFFFATSNSVKELKPELLRDGRFSIRYSLFLPVQTELEDIVRFHLHRVNRDLAGGRLFDGGAWHEDARAVEAGDAQARRESAYICLARRFFDDIAGEKKPYFYTGANIESLIDGTNRLLRRLGTQPPYSPEVYLSAMQKMARDPHSQPYGITNMRQIVNYWIDAFENHYTDAGESGPLSFDRFDGEKFEPLGKGPYTAYDRKMYDVISKRIEQEVQKRSDQDTAIQKAARQG